MYTQKTVNKYIKNKDGGNDLCSKEWLAKLSVKGKHTKLLVNHWDKSNYLRYHNIEMIDLKQSRKQKNILKIFVYEFAQVSLAKISIENLLTNSIVLWFCIIFFQTNKHKPVKGLQETIWKLTILS